jgi:hypothetical protein
MGLNVTHITRACLQHWARLADENPDAAALVVTRPNASLQEPADLVVKLRPSTDRPTPMPGRPTPPDAPARACEETQTQ